MKKKYFDLKNNNKNGYQQWRASIAAQGPAHWAKLRMLAEPLAGISVKMIKKLILSFIIIIWGINDNIAQNVEEIALLTLVDSLYHSHYDEHKAIFSGYTEEKYPKWMPFYFEDDLELEKILEASKDLDEPQKVKISIKTDKVSLKKYRLLNKPSIQVYPRLQYNNRYYVYITVYKKLNYVGHYFFEFDQSKKLTNSWYSGEII